jgi:hypothetical protein
MNKVSVDKTSMTFTAQGGCLAEALDIAAEKEGLSVVMGAVNDTGNHSRHEHIYSKC